MALMLHHSLLKLPAFLFKRSVVVLFCICLLSACISTYSSSLNYQHIEEKQVLVDNQSGVDGLAGARVAEFTPDGKQVLVTSADDNALAIFNIDENFHLTFSNLFVNNSVINSLHGATSVVLSPNGDSAYVVSYYDSALSVFEKDHKGRYQFVQAYRDDISHNDVFSDDERVKQKDKLGLRGAYDIAMTSDNRQLFIASVASNAISIFNITNNGNLAFSTSIRDDENTEYGFSGAVNIVVTPDNAQVIVAGYNENAITVFDREASGSLKYRQTLRNDPTKIKYMLKPQGITTSPDGQYLYVASSEGSALIVFSKNRQGFYSHLQSLSNFDLNIKGLGGAGYVTTSPDGKRIFVASESDNAIVILTKQTNGMLKITSVIESKGAKKTDALYGAASAILSPDGKHLLVTTGKGDSLIVYRVD